VRVELRAIVSRRNRIKRISCAVLLLTVVGACSSSHHGSSPRPTSSAQTPGSVASSPTGVIAGSLVLLDHSGIPGTITILDASGQGRKVTASPTGIFRIEVPAGSYRVTGRSPKVDNDLFECSNVTTAVVTHKETTNIRVICTEDHLIPATSLIRNAELAASTR
jgi:hypothetical protein